MPHEQESLKSVLSNLDSIFTSPFDSYMESNQTT